MAERPLAERVAVLETTSKHISDELVEIKQDVKEILATLNKAKGGKYMLTTVAASIGAIASWIASYWKGS